MKHSILSLTASATLLALTGIPAHAASAGYVDFGKLAPDDSGSQFVEVNVTSNLISMAARLTQKSEPDVADLLRGLESIRVNVIGLNNENREDMESRVKKIRTQLDAQGWQRIVTVQEKKQDVGVYLKTKGEEAVEGVVVTVLDGKKQAVLINVVGNIQVDKLATLGEKFDIDPLKKVGHPIHKGEAEKE